MRLPFRDHHLIQFLESWKPTTSNEAASIAKTALDRALYLYFRAHKALGSKDREAIACDVYQLVRWYYCLDALHPNELPASWHKRLNWLRQGDLEKRHCLPPAARSGFPEPLFNLMESSLGDRAHSIAEVLQETAPVFLRVNTLKISREKLIEQLPETWHARVGSLPNSIVLDSRPAIFQSEWFKQGYFEMQDEGSQYLANLIEAQAGDWVLDYCAGSGGKTLAIAPLLEGKGQLFLHDVRKSALAEAKLRLRRAGIQNAQVLSPDHIQLKRLKRHCQWVLVDAPCSGSGTLRRNPDMKSRIDLPFVQKLRSMQRCIFEKALSFVASQGRIVYATCSIFKEENEEQVQHFLTTYDLELVGNLHRLLPEHNGHDGFFAAVMRKKNSASK